MVGKLKKVKLKLINKPLIKDTGSQLRAMFEDSEGNKDIFDGFLALAQS